MNKKEIKNELDMLSTRQYNRLIELTELIEKPSDITKDPIFDLIEIKSKCRFVLKQNSEDVSEVFYKIELGVSDE